MQSLVTRFTESYGILHGTMNQDYYYPLRKLAIWKCSVIAVVRVTGVTNAHTDDHWSRAFCHVSDICLLLHTRFEDISRY